MLLVVSPRLWYPAKHGGGSQLLEFDRLEDQQLAGLVMWVPAGLIYGGAALLLAGLWIRSSGEKSRERRMPSTLSRLAVGATLVFIILAASLAGLTWWSQAATRSTAKPATPPAA